MPSDRKASDGAEGTRDGRKAPSRMPRLRLLVPLAAVVALALCLGVARVTAPDPTPADGGASPVTLERPLPAPEAAPGERGKLGVDANVNESTIDAYLGRDGVAYRDVRMLKDAYDWEAIGGDSRLSGYVEGFEVVPLPYLMPTEGAVPAEVGEGYSGPTLFRKGDDGKWEPVFYESMDILEDLFPPDRDIVLMCGGGGYAGMAKELLVSLGWREDHIWNAGGWWYYEGGHGVDVARDNGHGQTTWDFHEVPYHGIDFSVLHEVGSEPDDVPAPAEVAGGVGRIGSQAELEEAVAGTDELFVYVYLPGCSGCTSFVPVVSELDGTGQIRVKAMAYGDLGDGRLRAEIGHAPGALVYREGRLVASLSADRDADMPAYRSLEGLTRWLSQYVGVEVTEGEARADIGCNDGC